MCSTDKFILYLGCMIAPIIGQKFMLVGVGVFCLAVATIVILTIIREIVIKKGLYSKCTYEERRDVRVYNILGKHFEAPIEEKEVTQEERDKGDKELEDALQKNLKFSSFITIINILSITVGIYYIVCYIKQVDINILVIPCNILIAILYYDCSRRVSSCNRVITSYGLITARTLKAYDRIILQGYKLYAYKEYMYTLVGGNEYVVMSINDYKTIKQNISNNEGKGDAS